MRKVDNNVEYEIIFDSGMNSQNESIEDIEEELQGASDSYRDTPKDVYEENLKLSPVSSMRPRKLQSGRGLRKIERHLETPMMKPMRTEMKRLLFLVRMCPRRFMQTDGIRGTHTRYPSIKFGSSQNDASYHESLDDAQENDYEDMV